MKLTVPTTALSVVITFLICATLSSVLQGVTAFSEVTIRRVASRDIQLPYSASRLSYRCHPSRVSNRRRGLALQQATTKDDRVPSDNDGEEQSAAETSTKSNLTSNRLDAIMSQLTSAFPVFVLSAAILGYVQPCTLQWVNQGSLISILLAAIMCGTGLTLQPADFLRVREQWTTVPLGVAAQFSIMPLTAWTLGRLFLLRTQPAHVGASLFLGLCLVGCSPGGTASNLVTLIAGADVALSVVLTSCSTLLAVVATPTLVKLLVGGTTAVSGWALCAATAKVVLGPVLLGMFLNQKMPTLARGLSRFTPLASVLLVSAICGGVVAQNASLMAGAAIGPTIVGSVLLLHAIGFALGYAVPRFGAKTSERTARTASIEVGMQNSALAVVLAQAMGAPDLACLPGALSATVRTFLHFYCAHVLFFSMSSSKVFYISTGA